MADDGVGANDFFVVIGELYFTQKMYEVQIKKLQIELEKAEKEVEKLQKRKGREQ